MPTRPPFRNPSQHFDSLVVFTRTQVLFLSSISPWEKKHWSDSFGTPHQHSVRQRIKKRLKTKLETIQDNFCAFCGIDLGIVAEVHREHIAPQYKHRYYIFEPENLVLACYDCNDFKGKKLTVENDTGVYSTTTFKILHPYRDNFNEYLECDFAQGQLIFAVIDRVGKERAIETIKKLGLLDPTLMKSRGMKILYSLKTATTEDDELVKRACSMGVRKKK